MTYFQCPRIKQNQEPKNILCPVLSPNAPPRVRGALCGSSTGGSSPPSPMVRSIRRGWRWDTQSTFTRWELLEWKMLLPCLRASVSSGASYACSSQASGPTQHVSILSYRAHMGEELRKNILWMWLLQDPMVDQGIPVQRCWVGESLYRRVSSVHVCWSGHCFLVKHCDISDRYNSKRGSLRNKTVDILKLYSKVVLLIIQPNFWQTKTIRLK